LVRRSDPALNIGVAVYNESDQLLFWSLTSDRPEEGWPRLAEGPVRLRMILPQRLLNEGAYRVELLASLHARWWLLEPRANAPSVTFSIRGGLSDSPFWDNKRPGLLAPVLSWKNF
jgi:lipopolysaccharide transport system ATP-binding protein